MTLNAQVALLDAPDTAGHGVPFTVRFRVQNTGTEAFDPKLYKLGFQHPQDNDVWGADRIFLPEPLPAGGVLDFDTQLTPENLGKQVLSVQMLKEGVVWFGNATIPKQISVAPAPPPQKPMIPPRSDLNDLLGQYLIHTGPFPADGPAPRQFYWRNTSGRTIYIKMAGIWLGCDTGLVCDADADLVRESDGSLLVAMPTDHYADGPEGGARKEVDFSPYYVALLPDERLVLLCWGNDGEEGRSGKHVFFAAYAMWRYKEQ